jgi:hypothetical protein
MIKVRRVSKEPGAVQEPLTKEGISAREFVGMD